MNAAHGFLRNPGFSGAGRNADEAVGVLDRGQCLYLKRVRLKGLFSGVPMRANTFFRLASAPG